MTEQIDRAQKDSDNAFLLWKGHWMACTNCHGLCYPWQHRFWCGEGKRLWHDATIKNNRLNRLIGKAFEKEKNSVASAAFAESENKGSRKSG